MTLPATGDQRSTTESTEIHGKENPNQLPLSPCPSRGRAHARRVGSPARRVGSFRGYPFLMIFLAWVRDALHADGVSGVGELDVGP